ncbi:MAG: helix-turn-helix domain-containing protein [Planctomycetes bacterium]|nr:helix-turn-helix domain-containing protein [Planctomycetota bacterium]
MSPKRVIIVLPPSEYTRLKDYMINLSIQGKWKERRRAEAVIKASDGFSVPQIAEITKSNKRSIYRWMKNYQDKGIYGLYRAIYHIKLTDVQVEELLKTSNWAAVKNRKTLKKFRDRWTFREMSEWVKNKWGIKISPEAVRKMTYRQLKPWLPTPRKRAEIDTKPPLEKK